MPAEPPRKPGLPCELVSGEVRDQGGVTVGLTEPVDRSHAPTPANESERLVFRHLYETLVGFDCEGDPSPQLAESWVALEDGRIWDFVLRPEARFWDGSPITAADVQRAWAATEEGPSWAGHNSPWTWVRPESVRIVGDRLLRVALVQPLGSRPVVFAHPALAVAKKDSSGTGWMGSGPYLIEPTAGKRGFTCPPNPYHPEATRGLSPLHFRVRAGADQRDVLAEGIDVLLVTRRAVREYAARIPDLTTHALPWINIYFLVAPHFSPSAPAKEADRALSRLRGELAMNVMKSDARAMGGLWQEMELNSCRGSGRPAQASSQGTSSRILYSREDADGGELADRLVAVTEHSSPAGSPSLLSLGRRKPGGAPVVAANLPWFSFLSMLKHGNDLAYVVPLRQSFPDPCLDLESFLLALDWSGAPMPPGSPVSESRIPVLPLVTTRYHLVSRRGLVNIGLDWDGTVLLHRAGWVSRDARREL